MPVFQYYFDVLGYGFLEEVSALYGLMWVTPELTSIIKQRLLGFDTSTGYRVPTQGVHNFFNRLIHEENLQVRYNTKVIGLQRHDGIVTLTTINPRNQLRSTLACDFVVWSPDMRTSLQYWQYTPEEYNILPTDRQVYMSRSVVEAIGMKRGNSPVVFQLDRNGVSSDHHLASIINSFSVANNFKGELYRHAVYPTGWDLQKKSTVVVTQFSRNFPTLYKMNKSINDTFTNYGAKEIHIDESRQHQFKYFQHFRHELVRDGILYRILELQGERQMWYIGSSVSFASFKSELEYNLLLMSKFSD